MVNDNKYLANCGKEQDEQKLIFNFPYNELPNVSPTNLVQIRKCLPYLLQISQNDLFYTNSMAVKYTLEFTTSMLASIDSVSSKDAFVDLLILLKEILIRLAACNQLDDAFPDMTKLFDLLLYVSDLDVFCKYCANICQCLLDQLLKSLKTDFTSVDDALTGILENLKKIKADTEVAIISEVILLRFPLEANAYKLSAYWLMEDSIRILQDVEVELIQDESKISSLIRNIYTFFMKVATSVNTQSELLKCQKSIAQFVNDLMDVSPKMIRLCCARITGPEAKKLLGLVLHEFLRRQDVLSEETVMHISQDMEKFPANVQDWPKYFSRTFFWLCHLLYYHQKCLWTTSEICGAIRRLLCIKENKKALNVHLLKSVCYVYPITLAAPAKISEGRRLIGDALLNTLPTCPPLLSKVLSISSSQLVWIMCRGSSTLKLATVKFWLGSSQENLAVLKEVLVETQSEKCLIDILLSAWDSQNPVVHKAIEVIQSLHSDVLLEEMPLLILRFGRSANVGVALMRACCLGTPRDKSTALEIFNSVYQVLKTNPDDEVLTGACHCIVHLLTALERDEDFIQSVCSNQFWLRYPVSRIPTDNDSALVAIMRLLTKILTHQQTSCLTQERLPIDLAPLLSKSLEVVQETVIFLGQLLTKKTLIVIKKKHILSIVYRLCDLTDTLHLSGTVYGCLTGLLLQHSKELINSPVLGMMVEEKCQLLSRRNQSAASLKFMLLWIKLMYHNPQKGFCYLPRDGVLTTFIRRIGLLDSRETKYMHFISEIYSKQIHASIEEQELVYNFNLSAVE